MLSWPLPTIIKRIKFELKYGYVSCVQYSNLYWKLTGISRLLTSPILRSLLQPWVSSSTRIHVSSHIVLMYCTNIHCRGYLQHWSRHSWADRGGHADQSVAHDHYKLVSDLLQLQYGVEADTVVLLRLHAHVSWYLHRVRINYLPSDSNSLGLPMGRSRILFKKWGTYSLPLLG